MLTILIPVRPFAHGKSRLAGVLDEQARRHLNERLFAHVLGIACETVGAARCLVVSRSGEVRTRAEVVGAAALDEGPDDRPSDLNAALDRGRDAAIAAGASTIITVSTDLPLLAAEDLAALIAVGQTARLVVAPDRHGLGTNALKIADPARFRFAYGAGSRAAHAAQADDVVSLMRRGLSHDLDDPGDLALLKSWRAPVPRRAP